MPYKKYCDKHSCMHNRTAQRIEKATSSIKLIFLDINFFTFPLLSHRWNSNLRSVLIITWMHENLAFLDRLIENTITDASSTKIISSFLNFWNNLLFWVIFLFILIFFLNYSLLINKNIIVIIFFDIHMICRFQIGVGFKILCFQ